MKKNLLFASGIIVFALSIYFVNPAKTNTGGPNAGLTGAPGNSTCTNCHSGAGLNAGPETFVITPPVSQYTPGTTYTITASFSTTSRTKHGFQITALNASNQMAGTFVSTNNRTQTQTSGGRTYLNHTSTGTAFSTWTFNWTAPSVDVGTITFYAAGNATNSNSSPSGDNIYTTTAVLTPATPAGLPSASNISAQLSVYPNPVSDRFTIKSEELSGKLSFARLIDLKGSIVDNYTLEPSQWVGEEVNLEIPRDLKSGLYTLQIISGSTVATKKIVVSK